MITLKLKTSKEEIKSLIAAKVEEIDRRIFTVLSVVGERCINDARLFGSYTDRTGNLRSSIGYAIVSNGEVVKKDGFRVVSGSRTENEVTVSYSGDAGAETGEKFLDSLCSSVGSQSQMVLIVVAGMNYASYVQDRGYNVTLSAEDLANRITGKLLKRALSDENGTRD